MHTRKRIPDPLLVVDSAVSYTPVLKLWPELAPYVEEAPTMDRLTEALSRIDPAHPLYPEAALMRAFYLLQRDMREEVILQLDRIPTSTVRHRGISLWLEGHLQEKQHKPREAFSLYERAYTILRHLPGVGGWLLLTLDGLGRMSYVQRDYATAAMYYQQALSLARTEGFRPWVRVLAHNVGVVLQYLDGLHEAERYLQEALSLAQEGSDERAQALALFHLAHLYHERFRYYGLAIPYYECALILFFRQGMPELHSRTRSGLVRCRQALDTLNVAALVGLMPIEELEARYTNSLLAHFSETPRPEAYAASTGFL